MRKAIAVLVGSLIVGLSLTALARTDVWDPSTVKVYKVELTTLTDGGCAVQAWASYSKQDGGRVAEGSERMEVSGANRTTCLDILNNKAPVLFKADRDL